VEIAVQIPKHYQEIPFAMLSARMLGTCFGTAVRLAATDVMPPPTVGD